MKNYIKLLPLCLLAFACGAPADGEYLDIGEAREPIFMPTLYGIEGGTGFKCNPAWENGECWVPDNNDTAPSATYFISAATSGCTQFMLDRFNEVINEWVAVWAGVGWTATQAADINHSNHNFFCDHSRPTSLGRTVPLQEEAHTTVNGQLRQFKQASVYLYDNNVVESAGWAGASDAKRKTFVRNLLRHEIIGHLSGIGHDNDTTANTGLMEQHANGFDNTKGFWTGDRQLRSTDIHAMDCYTATSGTSASCPSP